MEYDMAGQQEFIIGFAVVGVVFLCLMQFFYTSKQARLRIPKEPQSSVGIFVLLAAIAFSIRVAVSYGMPGYVSDVECFLAWSDYAYADGFASFYSGEFFADYPPLYIYVLSFIGWLRDIGGVAILSPESLLLIRMPALIADIAMAAFVYALAKKEINGRAGLFLSALILFNPAVMMNSAVWGQVDVLVTIMMALVLYMLYKDKLIWSAVLLMLAILLKPQAIMIAPVVLFVFIHNIRVAENKKKAVGTLLVSLAAMVGVFFIVPLPFGAEQEPLWLVERLMQTMGQYPQATLNAFNVYGLAGLNFVAADTVKLFGLPLNVWGFIFVAVICVYAGWLYYKNPNKRFLFAIAAFIVLAVFAFVHGMHERYIYVAPALLLFAYILMRDKRLFLCTVLVFGMALLNQCVSLYYYQVYIPDWIIVSASAAGLVVYAYTFYVITMLALYRPQLIKEPAPEDAPKKEKRAIPEQMRLETFKTEKHITGRDGLVMLIITAVYACVAFVNLGSFKIPETGAAADREIVIELGEQKDISKFKYYADFGEGSFTVSYSNDGANYAPAVFYQDGQELQEIVHDRSMLYKWHEYDAGIRAAYLKLTPTSGSLPLLEFALYDNAWNLIEPTGVSYADGRHISALFDEQALVHDQHSYMDEFYFDELYHVRTAYENIHAIQPYEWTHPPLGKLIIASGIELFGMNPFGWRFMGTLAGVLMLPVIYVLAKRMTKKTKYAAFAAILFAVDFMHFAQTRIGTIDSYSILWILLMYLFMYQYTQTNFNKQDVKQTLLPLFLCGVSFGLGAATKWLCIYAGIGLLAIFLVTMYRRYREYKYASTSFDYPEVVDGYHKKLKITLGCCVVFFIAVPAVIYLLSYIPYFLVEDGYAYTGISDIIDNQRDMLYYHGTLDPEYVHPFASKWYTWPADMRPVLFFSEQNAAENTVSTLSTMGNPLIWWGGIVAAVYLAIQALRSKRNRTFALGFIAIAALSQYMPWWFVSRELFIYHYFATVPFLILLIIFWLKGMAKEYRFGKAAGYVFVAACVVLFACFYPVITGVPADADYIQGLRWLESWPFY